MSETLVPPEPVVFMRVSTCQPWPTGTTVDIAGVTLEQNSNEPFVLNAIVTLPVDDTNDVLYEQARSRVETALYLLGRALPGYPVELESGYQIDRHNGMKFGTASLGAGARVRQPRPLDASDLEPILVVARTYEQAKQKTTNRAGRLESGAYWVEQSRSAPERTVRLLAALFAIESVLGASGTGIENRYKAAVSAMGFPVTEEMEKRINDLQQTRASLVHYGNIDPPKLEAHERWARNLAEAIVGHHFGLGAPASLALSDEA